MEIQQRIGHRPVRERGIGTSCLIKAADDPGEIKGFDLIVFERVGNCRIEIGHCLGDHLQIDHALVIDCRRIPTGKLNTLTDTSSDLQVRTALR